MCPVFFCLKKENSRVGTAVFAIEGIKKKTGTIRDMPGRSPADPSAGYPPGFV